MQIPSLPPTNGSLPDSTEISKIRILSCLPVLLCYYRHWPNQENKSGLQPMCTFFFFCQLIKILNYQKRRCISASPVWGWVGGWAERERQTKTGEKIIHVSGPNKWAFLYVLSYGLCQAHTHRFDTGKMCFETCRREREREPKGKCKNLSRMQPSATLHQLAHTI